MAGRTRKQLVALGLLFLISSSGFGVYGGGGFEITVCSFTVSCGEDPGYGYVCNSVLNCNQFHFPGYDPTWGFVDPGSGGTVMTGCRDAAPYQVGLPCIFQTCSRAPCIRCCDSLYPCYPCDTAAVQGGFVTAEDYYAHVACVQFDRGCETFTS